MSLKHVHAVFVAVAAFLAVMCGALALIALATSASGTAAASLAGSVMSAVLLVRYEVRFVRRWLRGRHA